MGRLAGAGGSSVNVGWGGTVIHRGCQLVDALKRRRELLDSRPQCRMLFPDLVQRGTGRPQGGEVETDIRACPRYGCPQGAESDDDIGYERRVPVGSKPAKVINGSNGPFTQHGRGFGCGNGRPVYRAVPFRAPFTPEGGAERFGGSSIVVGQLKGGLPKRACARVKGGEVRALVLFRFRIARHH